GTVGHALPMHVEVPRIPDRDALVTLLRDDGFDARPVDELGIEVTGEGDVLGDLETWIARTAIPLVPQPTAGSISLRPPASCAQGGLIGRSSSTIGWSFRAPMTFPFCSYKRCDRSAADAASAAFPPSRSTSARSASASAW